MIDLDKHRDSLAKYCYDLSKVILAVSFVNPLVTKTLSPIELLLGLRGAIGFLLLAILIERGESQ